MTKVLFVREILWELRLQDGPAENGVYYETEALAQRAKDKMSGGGVYVSCIQKTYPLTDALMSPYASQTVDRPEDD